MPKLDQTSLIGLFVNATVKVSGNMLPLHWLLSAICHNSVFILQLDRASLPERVCGHAIQSNLVARNFAKIVDRF